LLNDLHTFQVNVGDQDQLPMQGLVIRHQDPQRLSCSGNAHLEPAQLNHVQAGLPGMGDLPQGCPVIGWIDFEDFKNFLW
jgi:hypothetical protein